VNGVTDTFNAIFDTAGDAWNRLFGGDSSDQDQEDPHEDHGNHEHKDVVDNAT